MLTLKTVGRSFEVPLKVTWNGSGVIHAVISETDQSQIPSYVFVPPRQLARVKHPTALRTRHVVKTPSGLEYIVGENGPSEQIEGVLWQSFRLFQVTDYLLWTRRGEKLDPVTRLKREGKPESLGLIPLAVEPTDREEDERRLATRIEQARYISAHPLQADDYVGDYRIVRADDVLGVTIGMLNY